MKKYLIILMYLASLRGYSQSHSTDQEILERGKSLYNQRLYDSSMSVLHPLSHKNGNALTPYAGFYYMLSAYKKGFSYLAMDMGNRILINYPKWNNLNEVKLWMIKFYLYDKNYSRALSTVESVSGNELKKMAEALYLNAIDSIPDFNDVVSLYQANQDNELIARNLADRIIRKPLLLRDMDLLKQLVQKFNFDKNIYRTDLKPEGVKKERYKVAVLLPFMEEDIIPGVSEKNNQFVYDMYEGIIIGNEQLKLAGINLDIVAYDTKKSGVETRKLIQSDELNGVDIMIGPLYSDEVRSISEFSKEKQIMVCNPLSTNSEIIKNNPYTILFKPTTERQSRAAAYYAADHFKTNKNYFLFYGDNPRDSISAFTFRSILQTDSFNLNFQHRVSSEDTADIYTLLTLKVKLKDLKLPYEDSLRLLSHYSIDTAALRIANKKVEEQEIFVMVPDSIGFVYGASSNQLIATNIISGVETRSDHTAIIGNEDWLDVSQLSPEQFDRLNIVLAAPGFIDTDNPEREKINNLIIAKIHATPDKYHYLGYEMITYIGTMLNKYGSPFLAGLKKEGFYKGKIFYGFDYSNGQDNNIVPVIRSVGDKFIIVNSPETDDTRRSGY